MLRVYQLQGGGLKGANVPEGGDLAPGALWIDLVNPTIEERKMVDRALGMELPTRADMEEIEISSRLYHEDGGLFMTAIVLSQSDTEHPVTGAITFVLAREKLVTIRYIDPQPIRAFAARCERTTVAATRAETILLGLLDAIIDRMADILEKAGADVEAVSREIFEQSAKRTLKQQDFQDVLRRLGGKYDLTTKMRESLLTIGRMTTFLAQAMDAKPNKEIKGHIKTLNRDVISLQDHSSHVASKLTFLLDATLGLINIEQNNIIKIMSVAAMVFLPPTLIASSYGMNFQHMPELDWSFGYPAAILAMIVSGVLPYLFFKRRGWL